jgi:copper chaperone
VARVLLGVRGMTTPEAAEKVRSTLLALEGVRKVEAGTEQQAAVEYDEAELTIMDMIRALRKQGFLAGME